MATVYNPSNRFEIKSWDVEFRKAPERMLMARVYQPQGAGRFRCCSTFMAGLGITRTGLPTR